MKDFQAKLLIQHVFFIMGAYLGLSPYRGRQSEYFITSTIYVQHGCSEYQGTWQVIIINYSLPHNCPGMNFTSL